MGTVWSRLRRLGRGPALAVLLSGGAAALATAADRAPSRLPIWSQTSPAGRGLVDQTGAPLDEARFAGRLRLVYIGYTRCPDLCPTALMTMTQALDALPPALLARLVPVMIAADPEHDGPGVLARYLDTFHPAIVAVTGPVAVIDGLTNAFGPPIRRHDGVVDHPADLFLVGPSGTLLGRLPNAITPDVLAATLRAALAS
ncbi:SCO family protein [Methylobacterium terricola]|uniref:SCO family protein n=1 Tax=Methylobacterium terricola TaxID=2583531 RepID=A0A5C4LAD2_9HYPH|nr:SCO family protein [Methylobacterium terricola]TNC08240.1 SCO family protein [Methylobacterium terricola]